MSKAFLKTLATSRYGTISPLVRRVQNSNILVLACDYLVARPDIQTATISAGTLFVPDWRSGGNEPSFMVYANLNDALRGGANAAASQKANFDRHASSQGHYELVFGEKLAASDVLRIRAKADNRLVGQAGIVKNLSLWQAALWLEREASLSALRLVKAGTNSLLNGRVSWPVFRSLMFAEFRKLHCAPFADFAASTLLVVAGMRDTRQDGDPEEFIATVEEIEKWCAGMLRDQSLEDVDACLSRASSVLRRQTGSWRLAAEDALLSSFTLLAVAEAEHAWDRFEFRKLNGIRSRIGMVRKALPRERTTTAKLHLAAARAKLDSLVER